MLLVLDLDETLIYACEEGLESPPEFEVGEYQVYLRPYLHQFLEFVFDHFDVAVWTSASEGYALQVVENVFGFEKQLEFIWCRGQCTQRYDVEEQSHYWIKDFKKLRKKGYNLEQVLVVDDTPKKHERNYENLIYVSPFTRQLDDEELNNLVPFLKELQSVENVREVEKRGWQRKYRKSK